MKIKHISYLWYLSIALIILNIVLYLIKPGGDLSMTIISDLFPVVCSLIAIIYLSDTYRSFKENDRTRTAWLLILLGVVLDCIAETLYAGQEIFLGRNLSDVNKSISDIFWIVSYFFTAGGLVILLIGYVKSDFPRGKMTTYITLSAIGLVFFIALISILLVPILKDPETSNIDKAVYMTYPVADIIIVIQAVFLLYITSIFKKWLIIAPWLFIALAFFIMGVSDILFSYQSWQDNYGSGSFIDIGWNAGYLLLALAGIYQRKLMLTVTGGMES